MLDKGEVIEVNKNYLTVRVIPNSSCGSCHQCSEDKDGSCILKINNPGNIKPGEFIEIDIPERKVIQSAFLLYGLPILGLFFGFIVGSYIKLPLKQELISLFTGVLFMTVLLLLLKYLYKTQENSLLPSNIKKIENISKLSVKDIVCGMDVLANNPAAKVIYNGKAYFFCSAHCKNLFESNPQNYTKI